MTTGSSAVSTTVMDHILDRLGALGVRHLFGLPGDYNLEVLDRVLAHPKVKWVGTASELGAAYAADGYGRVNGFGALLTALGVGELSAINGVAGGYAERVPLLHIAVGPTRATERERAKVHHTAADGDFDRFARAHRQVVTADAVLRPEDAAAEVDRVLRACLRESRPGYLRVPRDVALGPVTPTGPLDVPDLKAADQDGLEAFRAAARARLAGARDIAVLADFLVDRFKARDELAALLAAGALPSATLPTGKTVVDESTPGFLGVYAGAMSGTVVRHTIDRADPLILAGAVLADMSTGKFTHEFDPAKAIDLGPTTAAVDGVTFPGVPLAAALKVLAELVRERDRPGEPGRGGPTGLARLAATSSARLKESATALSRQVCGSVLPLTQSYLWAAVGRALRPDNTVVADDGTPLLGIVDRRFPSGARFVGQPLWASIGYGIPALLGAQLADPTRRGLLVVGDGAAQLTAQELGTIGRHDLKPIVVLVNNDGYTIERVTHGLRAVYNDIARWHWADLPAALGVPRPLVLAAHTPAALDRALARAVATPDRFVLIEAFTGKDDVPTSLKRLVLNRPDRARWVP